MVDNLIVDNKEYTVDQLANSKVVALEVEIKQVRGEIATLKQELARLRKELDALKPAAARS